MWLRFARSNVTPFAGYMLREYEKQLAVQRAGEESDEAAEEVRPGETTCGELVDVPT